MADTWAATILDWANGNTMSESNLDQEIRDRWTVFLAAMDGDTSGTTVKHRHKVGTLAARPTPGESGRLYFPTDISIMLWDDGTEWHIANQSPTNCAHFLDDFFVDYSLTWSEGVTGSGTIDMVSGAGGIVQLDTSTSGNSNAKLLIPTGAATIDNVDPGKIGVYLIRLLTLQPGGTNQFIHSGLMSSMPSSNTRPSDGIYIEKDDGGNFFGVCRASSAETTQDLGTTAGSSTLFLIERTATGVKFYVDTFNAGGLQGSEITSNIPSATIFPGHRISNKAAASSRAMKLDTFGLWSAR